MLFSVSAAPPAAAAVRVVRDDALYSQYLNRAVRLDVVLPPGYDPAAPATYPVLCLNDGQDLWHLRLPTTLRHLYRRGVVQPFVLVAVHAHERIQEYGVAAAPDYLNRGRRAAQYGAFVRQELLPYVQQQYHATADPAHVVLAGCSLGGLTAFDHVWHYPEVAQRAGAFSGSFWWRRRALTDGYTDADRLMHGLVRQRPAHPAHRFWLQTGTLDETNDRNHNGIIDSIEDTLDLLAALARAGLPETHARYVEVVGGRHNQRTWARLMPAFLRWAFGAAAPEHYYAAEAAHLVRLWQRRARLTRRRHPAGASSLTFPRSTTMHQRPASTEYPPFYEGYITRVPDGADPLAQLQEQSQALYQLVGDLSDEQARLRYAPDKWSIKEMLSHLIDTERVFSYRALRIARGDQQALPGFEQNDYVATSGADARPLADLLAEYDTVRAATLSLLRSFGPEAQARLGVANGRVISVRALMFIIAGHETHHLHILQERYLPVLAA